MHGLNETVGQGPHLLAILRRPLDNLVIDIGDVADIVDLIATAAQITHHHIKDHHHPGMAQMTEIVDGHATDVDPHFAGNNGLQWLLGATQGVMDLEHHGFRLARARMGPVNRCPRHGTAKALTPPAGPFLSRRLALIMRA